MTEKKKGIQPVQKLSLKERWEWLDQNKAKLQVGDYPRIKEVITFDEFKIEIEAFLDQYNVPKFRDELINSSK